MSVTDTKSTALWRNPNFVLYLLCRAPMVTGRQAFAVAVGWDVYARTGDPVDLGLIGLCTVVPLLLCSIPAGLAADRLDRRFVLVVALMAQFLSIAATGAWFRYGGPEVWPIFLLLVIGGTSHAFLPPALHSLLPNIVPRAIFSQAVASASSVNKIAQFAGPVGAGLLIALGGQVVYIVAGLLYLFAALAIAAIRTGLRIREREPISLAMLFGGFDYVWATPRIFAAMSIDLIAVLFGGIMGILPVYAADILHVGAEGLGVMRAAPAVGAFGVALALSWRKLPWRVGPSFFVSLAVFGATILLFAFSTVFWLSLAALVVYGAADMVSVYVRQTLIQIDTPDDLRGRVGAVHTVTAGGSTQLGDMRAGLMAGLVGAPAAIAAGGLVTLGAAFIWHRRYPELARMERF